MGVEDFHLDDFDDDALESSRYEREGRLHGASTPPGQSDVFSGSSNDMFSNSVEDNWGNDGGMNDIFSSPFASNQGATYGNTQPQQPEPAKTTEDKFFDALKKGGITALDATKDILHSDKTNALFKVEWGRTSAIAGIICMICGILLRLFGLTAGLQISVGGILGIAFCAVLWGFNEEKSHTDSPMFGESDTSNNVVSEPNMNFDNSIFSDAEENNSNFFDDNEDEDEQKFNFFDDGEDEMGEE